MPESIPPASTDQIDLNSLTEDEAAAMEQAIIAVMLPTFLKSMSKMREAIKEE